MNNKAIHFHSRMVGLTFVITVLIGFFNVFYVKPNTYNHETLLASEFWFRSAQVLDLTMFGLVLWMILAIYLSIKHVSPTLAKFVLAFRLVEVVLGCVVVIVTFMTLLVLQQNSLTPAFDGEQEHAFYSLFLDLSNVAWAIKFCFLSIGAIIYFYLLHQSNGIPRWLCYWGFFTYITLFVGFFLKLLLPDFPDQLMLIMAPGALFEFTFGWWMLIKGIRLPEQRPAQAPEA